MQKYFPILISIGLLLMVGYLFLMDKEEQPISEGSPSEMTPTPSDELVPTETFSAQEQQQIEEKAAALAQEAHYIDNVEQVGREGRFKRTSYYDPPIGVITSKAVNINSVIYAGGSELNLSRGVATVDYREGLDEHTVAIAGHRATAAGQFLTGALYLKPGHEITVQQYKEGTEEVVAETSYVVDNTFTVTPDQVHVLEEDKPKSKRKLVLITCYKYNPDTGLFDERFIVNAYEK